MNAEIDAVDARLLGLLQESVPCCERPFLELGNALGLTEGEVIDRVCALKDRRIIRQISAIFDTRSLGYASSLVAAKVSENHLEQAVAEINAHPGVSHNYLRNHEFNLWYTIAVPPDSQLGLDGTLDVLHARSGAEITRALPTLRLFKIGVRFDVEGADRPGDRSRPGYTEANRMACGALTEQEIHFVRMMQRDLELTPEPFVAMAGNLGMTFEELMRMQREFLANGRMRRFAAVLHHRKAGFGSNAMGVWAGPQEDPEQLRQLGETMAGFRAVSHCYQRPHYPDWPYNLFTMVHGRSEDACLEILAEISRTTGIRDYHALFSTKEFKKVRVRYFTRDEREWEADQVRALHSGC